MSQSSFYITTHDGVKIAVDLYADICRPGGIFLSWFLNDWGYKNRLFDRNTFVDSLDFMKRLILKGVRPVDDDKAKTMLANAILSHSGNWEVFETLYQITYRDDNLDYDRDW